MPWALVVFSSSTMASYCGLFMKLSTDTCCADGDIVRARAVRSWCVTIRSTSSVRLAIATFCTSTSAKPAFLILLRSTEAPIALDPMPASQAKTMRWIGSAARVPRGAPGGGLELVLGRLVGRATR